MPRYFLFALVVAGVLAMAGCSTLTPGDRRMLLSHEVSQALYRKMQHHEPLTLAEIVELTHRGVPGPFIVHYLRPTYFVYQLTPGDVSMLRKEGVEDGVIRYLAATPTLFSPQRAPVWVEDDPFFSGSHKDYWRY